MVPREDALVEGVEALDDGRDEHDDHADRDHIVRREQRREPFCPAQVRVRRPVDALDEDDIDDEEDDDANSNEDLRRGQFWESPISRRSIERKQNSLKEATGNTHLRSYGD